MTVHLKIRGYLGTRKVWERPLDFDAREIEKLIPKLATEHAEAMVARTLTMVEIEFLDEPDESTRYFRIGTDPSGMVVPIGFRL